MPATTDSTTPLLFEPGADLDMRLLHWWSCMQVDGSFSGAFDESLRPLAAFLKYMTGDDVTVMYVEDEKGWWGVCWFAPVLSGGAWGYWLRQERRGRNEHTQANVDFAYNALAWASTIYPVMLVTTKQPAVAESARQFGFQPLGTVPQLFAGEPCHILYATREQLAASHSVWGAWHEQPGKS